MSWFNLNKDRYAVCFNRNQTMNWYCTPKLFDTIKETVEHTHKIVGDNRSSINSKIIPISGLLPTFAHNTYLQHVIRTNYRVFSDNWPSKDKFVKESQITK